jgi:hypothetical protein
VKRHPSFITRNCFLVSLAILAAVASMLSDAAGAATYYLSATGSDAADGLTPSTPWLSIAKVNQTKFSPGDAILFKRGDAWREGQSLYGLSSGAAGKPIVFGAYGKGAKPLILASKDISAPAFWTRSAENIWRTTSIINVTNQDLKRTGRITPDVANLIFNHEESVGVKKRFLADLATQGDFCLNLSDTLLYVCSTDNPSRHYRHIEATGIRNCENNIEVVNGHHLTFSNLDIRYSKNNGLFLRDCSHIEISDCDFSWIGGCYFPIQTFMNSPRAKPVRMGNGVQLWMGNSDVTVKNCVFNQVYDAGISPQGGDARVAAKDYAITRLRFHHNVINNCFYSFEFWGHQTNSTADGIWFEHNTCLNSGRGWSTAQRPDQGGSAHLKFFESSMSFTNVFIRNNIFAGSADACLSSTDRTCASFQMDHNCYFKASREKPVIRWAGGAGRGGGDFFMDDLRAYQTKSGKESHSLFADPGLDPHFALLPGSPALDAGMDAGYPFSGPAPDLGASETK